MKHFVSASILAALLFGSACTDTKDANAKDDAAAKARANAAKKEMETLPDTLSTPDYYKKNQPAKSQPTTQKASEADKK